MANPAGYADRGTTLSAADREFASKAAQGGMAEVQMGNLAQQKGSTDGVKDYGRKLVQDHTRMNNDLKDIATRENITLPAETSSEHRQNIDTLSKLSGANFDREFLRMAVDDHRKDIPEFEKEAESGQDAALKNFAASNLPTLRDHLSMAETLSGGATRSR